jgi:hypothetical protein
VASGEWGVVKIPLFPIPYSLFPTPTLRLIKSNNFYGIARRFLMFLDELSPIFKHLTQQPISFLGGFFSGVLRLNLKDDPVKSWLDQQRGSTGYTPNTTEINNGKATGPQTISIE